MINLVDQKESQVSKSLQYKDKSIVSVVNHLSDKFGKESFVINDFWDADLCAIGLIDKKKKYLFYISTFLKKSGVYFVSCENILIADRREHGVSGNYRNIDIKKLDYLFIKHMGVEETPQNSRQI